MKNQSVSGHDEQESVNLKFIKMQVLDMAERFDQIEQTQRSQNIMLSYLVQSSQRKNTTASFTGQSQQKREFMPARSGSDNDHILVEVLEVDENESEGEIEQPA